MQEPLDPKALAELTTEIVAAYVAHHTVATTEIPVLIDAVAAGLARLGTEGKEEAAPARAVEASRPRAPTSTPAARGRFPPPPPARAPGGRR